MNCLIKISSTLLSGQLERYYNHVKTVTYFNLQQQHFIEADAAVPGLSRNQAYSLFILIPDKSVINEFDKIIKPIFEILNSSCKCNFSYF